MYLIIDTRKFRIAFLTNIQSCTTTKMPSVSTRVLKDVVRQIKSYGDAHTSLDVSELFGFEQIDFLQDDTIDDELNAMVDVLTVNPNLAIEEFVLRYPMYKVGEQGVIALAVLFLQNTTIKSIVLDNVRFVGPYGLRALLGALKYNRTVTYLKLASDDEPFDPFGGPDSDKTILSQNCIVELANVLRENPVLERVCLCPNGLTDQDVINHLAPALAINESIIKLDVSSNSGITEVGLSALREAMGGHGVVIGDDNWDDASE